MDTFSYKIFKFTLSATIVSMLSVPIVQAQDLRTVLQYVLKNDPILLEAQADVSAADSRVYQAISQHLPKARLVGTGLLAEHHKKKNNYTDNRFEPAVQMSLNLTTFGAITSDIKKNKALREYSKYKFTESKEQLSYTVANLYLMALNAKDSIRVLKGSLRRHQAFLNEVGFIVRQDQGRHSEFVQAQARKILVEQKINQQKRILETTLVTLSKFVTTPLTEKDLKNPFSKMTKSVLVKKYTSKDHQFNPTYQAQKAEVAAKKYEIKAARARLLPSVDLVSTIGREDQSVSVQFSWAFDIGSGFSLSEKKSLERAANMRLNRINRDVDESSRLALVNIDRAKEQLSILKRQKRANAQVTDFYKLQFKVARKSLLDVLNAENELSEVELAYINTQRDLNQAILDYLRAQGKIRAWVK
ncbi:MAG: TolC family protein [Alcaligenaceae bacterium]|nr:TolC family protein [Alcaligenaceae bacterium]